MKRLNELTATEAIRWMAQGKATSAQLVRTCLERTAEREPVVGAWEYLDPETALAQARERDRRGSSGALHGVPFGIKDIIDTFADVDILLAPAAAGEAPVGLHATGNASFSAIWTTMHVPAISVPAFTGPNGLPIGVQAVAASGADRRLFEAARRVHRHIA
jgi:Asp-tRNA(Asn)/Glu-tRNA(Gln) amidotransferase A subunit family amidase